MNEKTRISPTADPLADIDPAQRQNFDQQKIENAVREIIIAIGEDPDRDGLQDTPARVAKINFPAIRFSITRPAIDTIFPVFASGAKSLFSFLTSKRV